MRSLCLERGEIYERFSYCPRSDKCAETWSHTPPPPAEIAVNSAAVSAVSAATGTPPPPEMAAPGALLDALTGVFRRRPLNGTNRVPAEGLDDGSGASLEPPRAAPRRGHGDGHEQPEPLAGVSFVAQTHASSSHGAAAAAAAPVFLVLHLPEGPSARVLSALSGVSSQSDSSGVVRIDGVPAAATPSVSGRGVLPGMVDRASSDRAAPVAAVPSAESSVSCSGCCSCGRMRPADEEGADGAGSLRRAGRAVEALWSLAHCPHGAGLNMQPPQGCCEEGDSLLQPGTACLGLCSSIGVKSVRGGSDSTSSEPPQPQQSPAPCGFPAPASPVESGPQQQRPGPRSPAADFAIRTGAGCDELSLAEAGSRAPTRPFPSYDERLRGTAAARFGAPPLGWWDRSAAERRYGAVVAQLMGAAAEGRFRGGGASCSTRSSGVAPRERASHNGGHRSGVADAGGAAAAGGSRFGGWVQGGGASRQPDSRRRRTAAEQNVWLPPLAAC